MKLILKDTSKFEEIETDQIKVINFLVNMENRFISVFKILNENNEINRETCNTLYPVGPKPGAGVLYRLVSFETGLL